jgi:hypothetical protein
MNPNVVIANTGGLSTHGNDLSAEPGSTSVADNVTFSRERLPELRRGFKDFSANLPDFAPEQLIVGSNGVDRYLHLDSGLWYYDTDAEMWLRKRGLLGARSTQPFHCVVVAGVLYYTTVRSVIALDLSSGQHRTIAGRFNVSGSTDGTGDAARFTSILGIATDGTNLYVCDGQTIRRLASPLADGAAVVTTIAGTAGASGTTDATGAAARFLNPDGIACDGTNLYVCDTGNHTVRLVAPPLTVGAAVVTTIAGTAGANGSANGTGAAARFDGNAGIAYDGTDLFVSDQNNNTVRRLAPPLTAGAAVVTTIAGTAGANGQADGTGAAARFFAPLGLASDGTNLYVCDRTNHTIRKLAPPLTSGAAIVTTSAGVGGSSGSSDGIGSAARFNAPYGLCSDGTNLYVCDAGNFTQRKIYPSNYVTTISGVPGSAAAFFANGNGDGVFAGPD